MTIVDTHEIATPSQQIIGSQSVMNNLTEWIHFIYGACTLPFIYSKILVINHIMNQLKKNKLYVAQLLEWVC